MFMRAFIPISAILIFGAMRMPPRLPVVHEITMTADAYKPGEITVAVGDTVVWYNTDIVTHTATSRGSNWDSGRLKSGKRFRWVATVAGRFPYTCSTHRGMKGAIIVR
jgi:plastocyanin